MPRTLVASYADSHEQALIVEVHPDVAEPVPQQVLDAFKARLSRRRLDVGILITSGAAWFVRDTYKRLDFGPDNYEAHPLPLETLLKPAGLLPVARGERLFQQVARWLDAVARSWSTFISKEALPIMLPHFVGSLGGTHLEERSEDAA